jgi:hypothetical protein
MLIDGNGSQLESIQSAMKRHKAGHTILILDFIHVLEYLWKAAYSFYLPGSDEAENWVRERGLKLLQGKVSSVARGMQHKARPNANLVPLNAKPSRNATITF